ncbi:MAG: hypothetical protein HKN21_10800 [Candidatus Eisenbacteria bacterium]|uniref:Lipoprotein n=1 Tax=Eiseniibacteriota bacterium TaxID=2212470 RepID=A0A7Y2H313_UNCEI|nr:hypothetical protein [Candidatus Eisenbacteria bacterium]
MRQLWVLGLFVSLVFLGCAGSGVDAPTTNPTTDPVPDPPPPSEPNPEPSGDVYNVTLYTNAGPVYVDKFELEFNRRRGIYGFYGFFQDRYERFELVSFKDLERIDILKPMDRGVFDQILVGKEEMRLRPEQAFETRLTYRTGETSRFYAIISKFRGEKDFRLWELGMTGNNAGIQYIEFDR